MKTNDSSTKRNPFKRYQENKVARREALISNYLRVLKRTRAKFEYVTDLAKSVAVQVGMTEGKECNHSTLLRNHAYKSLLLNFMAGMPRNVEGALLPGSGPEAELEFMRLRLDVTNLRSDNERLRAYIEKLERKSERECLTEQNADAEVPSGMRTVDPLLNDLARANKAIWLIIDHFKDLIVVDRQRACIVDLTALRTRNVIVDQDTAKPFLQWLQANEIAPARS